MLLEPAPLEILPPAYRGPRGRILLDLKRNGFNTAKALAESLRLSLNTVRHHLKELEAEHLVEHRREQRGLGAPTFAFRLSRAGQDLFPQRCHEVASQILDRMSEAAGRSAVTEALEERFAALAGRLELEPALEPSQRLDQVRQALVADGFMAEWTRDDAGYRLTEHHTAGGMSRTLSHLAELQPEIFCEISLAMAKELSIVPGEWVTVVTARGAIEAHALVTPRIKTLTISGKTVYQVGLPYHWGYNGLVKGDVANDLVAISEEPNVRIMETKGLLCNVYRGRRAENVKAIGELQMAQGAD